MAELYIYIYLIILGLILLFQNSKLQEGQSPYIYGYTGTSKFVCFLLLIICIIFIGIRPLDIVFADMVGYYNRYISLVNTPFVFNSEAENYIFDNILPFVASFGVPHQVYFILIAAIYFGGMYITCKKLFPNNLLISFIVCLTAFSTFSYGTNGIKAGAAASIFLVAIAYRDKLWITIPLALLSCGFHHSMSMVLVAYFLSCVFKKTKWYYIFWLICLVMAIAHISYFQLLFANYTDAKGASYLIADSDSAFLTGFRPDFILYSSIPVIIGYYIRFKKQIYDEGYELWLRIYVLTNSVWMLCMYASFSNRIAYLSWFLYPIVLIYPYLAFYWSDKQAIYAKKVVLYHYLFTFFMMAIFYTLIKIKG